MSHGSYLVCGCGRWIFTNRLGGHPYCHCGRKWMPEPAKSSKRPSKPRPRQSDKAWGWNPWHQTDYAPLMAEPQPKRMANFVSQQPMPEVQGVLAEHWDQLPEAVQSALVQVGVDSPESAPMQDESDPKYITQQYKQATGHLRALGQRKFHQDLKA